MTERKNEILIVSWLLQYSLKLGSWIMPIFSTVATNAFISARLTSSYWAYGDTKYSGTRCVPSPYVYRDHPGNPGILSIPGPTVFPHPTYTGIILGIPGYVFRDLLCSLTLRIPDHPGNPGIPGPYLLPMPGDGILTCLLWHRGGSWA